MKYVMCNLHNNYYYFKYFVYNESNFILFHCDFSYNLLYDIIIAKIKKKSRSRIFKPPPFGPP